MCVDETSVRVPVCLAIVCMYVCACDAISAWCMCTYEVVFDLPCEMVFLYI